MESLEEEFNKRSIKKRSNGIYLSDEQIEILNRYDFDYRKYNSINSLLFDIEDYLNDSYSDLDDLEYVSKSISEFNYYHNTNK